MPGMKKIRVAQIDDWGHLTFYGVGPKGQNVFLPRRLKEVTVVWPDGHQTQNKVRYEKRQEEVQDHGNVSYVMNSVPTIQVVYFGHPIQLDLVGLYILRPE